MNFRMPCFFVVLAGLVSFGISSQAFAECADDALRAMDAATQSRGIVSDLDLMKAWYADVGASMRSDNDQFGSMFDPRELGYSSGTQWMWWSDSFEGFSVCAGGDETRVGLDRSWWGAYAQAQDFENGIGYDIFYLRATDGLAFPGDLGDFEYAWSQRIGGGSLWWRDWARLSLGTIDVQAPQRTAEPLHSGSIYFNLGIPRFGLGADIVTRPNSRRLDSAMLGVRRRPLPWWGMTVSANAGWLDREQVGLVGFGVGLLHDAVSVTTVWEGVPVRMRSTTIRLENEHAWKWGDELWTKLTVTPYVEVSAFDSAAWEAATGRSMLPGAATGVRIVQLFANVQFGLDGFFGVNRAAELDRMFDVNDRLQWGGRVYLRLGI